jgi:hypothetical protein
LFVFSFQVDHCLQEVIPLVRVLLPMFNGLFYQAVKEVLYPVADSPQLKFIKCIGRYEGEGPYDCPEI